MVSVLGFTGVPGSGGGACGADPSRRYWNFTFAISGFGVKSLRGRSPRLQDAVVGLPQTLAEPTERKQLGEQLFQAVRPRLELLRTGARQVAAEQHGCADRPHVD